MSSSSELQKLFGRSRALAEASAVRVHPEMLLQFLTYRLAERRRLYKDPAWSPGGGVLARWVDDYDAQFNQHDS